MSVDTRMDKEDVVYIYNRLDYYWAIKKNEIGSFEATWMDLENAILSEVTSQQRDTSYDIPYIRNLKEIMQMNLFTKQKETHRLRKWTYGCQGERIVREFGKVIYMLLYSKWVTNRNLLYSKHMELYSMLCASLDGRGIWGRTDTCICMTESLRCSPETTTTLLTI